MITMTATCRGVWMGHCKGIAVTARLKYVHEHFGDSGLERLRAALSADDLSVIDGHVLPHAWVPMRVFVNVNVAADRLFGLGDLALCRTMGAWAADYTLPRLFRLFYRLGTPMFVFNNAAKLWRAHYDTGQLAARRDADGPVHLVIRDFEEPHRAHCLSVLGWAAKSIALSGGDVTSAEETRCRTTGADACEHVLSWR